MSTEQLPLGALGADAGKALKSLVLEIVKNDADVRAAVKALVLGYIQANPAALTQAVATATTKALTAGDCETRDWRLTKEVRQAAAQVVARFARVAEQAAGQAVAAELARFAKEGG